ncbi:hypothetical protein BT96DRAFT_864080 [Gymnopus androsaceus JB14]|uniref:Cyanovirin-N domain-containing protein n=1 Tax=Gymnopus androsaceus JB14 TaxID=1447944 RepID=A0A6A4H5J9_9AGAR|nr:hypothetical protein BT96DRAFT_864080 [Gymnopus androsaceus JB14]
MFFVLLLAPVIGVHLYSDWKNADGPAVRERERRRAQWDAEDRKREIKRAQWDAEDRARLEDEEHRNRTALYWEGPSPDNTCLRYGARMYSARLMNIPVRVDGKKWCQETEIIIHGDLIAKPDFCNDKSGEIFGHWLRLNEPTCTTIWEEFTDKGCVAPGSGKRRIDAKLGLLQYIDGSWREMCSTTPADFWGHHLAGPDSCVNTGAGVWGIWVVEDEEC